MKKILESIVLLILVTVLFVSFSFAQRNPYNYATCKEHFQLYYDAYIQCIPGYDEPENGHAMAGWIRFQNGLTGDTGRMYTRSGKHINDWNVYSLEYRYYDTPDWNAPKVRFTYGFDYYKNLHGSWSIEDVCEEIVFE